MKTSRKITISSVLFAAIALPTIAIAGGPGQLPPRRLRRHRRPAWYCSRRAGANRWRGTSDPCCRLWRLLARAALSSQVGQACGVSTTRTYKQKGDASRPPKFIARRAPTRPAYRSDFSEHEFSEPKKLVGQKAIPGGGRALSEAREVAQAASYEYTSAYNYHVYPPRRLRGCRRGYG